MLIIGCKTHQVHVVFTQKDNVILTPHTNEYKHRVKGRNFMMAGPE